MGEVKFMGLHSLEVLDCGCKLRRYSSGLNVIDTENRSSKCKNPTHRGFKEYQCRVCNKKFQGQKSLREHRWSHAI